MLLLLQVCFFSVLKDTSIMLSISDNDQGDVIKLLTKILVFFIQNK